MVTVTIQLQSGKVVEKNFPARVWVDKVRDVLQGMQNITIVSVEETELGEIRDAQAMSDLRDILPKLKVLAAGITLTVLMLLKLHLVRPDLILLPTNYRFFC
jgi:hypothetical protein